MHPKIKIGIALIIVALVLSVPAIQGNKGSGRTKQLMGIVFLFVLPGILLIRDGIKRRQKVVSILIRSDIPIAEENKRILMNQILQQQRDLGHSIRPDLPISFCVARRSDVAYINAQIQETFGKFANEYATERTRVFDFESMNGQIKGNYYVLFETEQI
ncbi:hypothetical protein L0156_28080 [bacterium]|nr:hypothetical protein [bacterium]